MRAIVIGAGLAGLACASDLATAGASVQVLEAADAAGGRMRTDSQAGFLLDRGFQVFNTSYPQVRRRMDLRALQLCPFAPGFILHADGGRIRFADPTRRPGQQADALLGRLAGPKDLAALAVFSARDMLGPPSWIRRLPEEPTAIALTAAGISRGLIERLFRPFLSGIFLEDDLDTSSRFFHLVWRSMLRGSLCLPRTGIQAVPAQLAGSLPDGTIELETKVTSLTDTGVLLADGTERAADAVVVATGPEAAGELLPALSVPPTRTVTTLYHAAAQSPLLEPVLLVDSGREVLHTSVLTEVTRSYSTDGRALISTSVLGGDAGVEPAVRTRLAQLYETDTSGWEHLSTCVVRGALPAMTAPHQLTRRCTTGPGRFVCGDYRATGSVQGALASGARAAREVLASMPLG